MDETNQMSKALLDSSDDPRRSQMFDSNTFSVTDLKTLEKMKERPKVALIEAFDPKTLTYTSQYYIKKKK